MVMHLVRRDVEGRYKGSLLGFAWALVNPLVLLGLYTFVFGYVFRARWGSGAIEYTSVQYAVVLYSGLILHAFFAECLNRAPGCVVGNPNFVKKVVFPLDILAWVQHGAAWFHFLTSLVILVSSQLLIFGSIPVTALLMPVVLLPLLLVVQGAIWCFSSLTVYFRDLAQVTGLLATCVLFASPVLYPMESVPEVFRPFLYINPLTPSLEMFRSVMLWGVMPDWSMWAIQLGVGILVFWLGYFVFQKSRNGFADVL